MDPVVGTLLGVVAGGVFSTGGAGWLDARRARREHAASAEVERKATRTAIRLVLEELTEAAALIEGAARTRRYWPQPRTMSTEAFNIHREQLAAGIDDAGLWRVLTLAYYSINDLNWTVGHRRAHSQEVGVAVHGGALDATDETRETWRTIYRAIADLEDLIGASGSRGVV